MIGILLLDLKKKKKEKNEEKKKKREKIKIKKMRKNGKLIVDWKGFENFSLPTCKQYDWCWLA